MISSYPRAIVHVDGDAFFASCEQAIHPELKGKPVVTGLERGIASSMSYEAKKKGVTRAMPYYEIKKICPDVVFLPSDYETYSLFSKRMFTIMRRYTNLVEEYSIDEGFADITGLRRPLNKSYQKIALCMKDDICRELNITVSVGLAPTKVLAKIASKYGKPNGYICIPGQKIMEYLAKIPVWMIWGVGRNTANYMVQLGIHTAKDFVIQPKEFVEEKFTKPHQEIWYELRGEAVYAVSAEEKTTYASISKTKTFTPSQTDASFVFAQLVKNIEGACIKARRHRLVGKKMYIFLKQKNFEKKGLEIQVNRATAYPHDILPIARNIFNELFQQGIFYRATGFVLADLSEEKTIQTNLFEDPLTITSLQCVYSAVDALAKKFGKHTVHVGGSLLAHMHAQHATTRGSKALRKETVLPGENVRQRLRIPLLFWKMN